MECTHNRTEVITPFELHPAKYGVFVWAQPYLECLDCHAWVCGIQRTATGTWVSLK